MNIRNIILRAAIFSVFVVFQSDAFADMSGEAILGRVRSDSDGKLRVCFEDHGTTLSAGQEFDVVRYTPWAPVKGVTALRSMHIGIIRITTIDDDQCAIAVLVHGEAQRLDWLASRAKA